MKLFNFHTHNPLEEFGIININSGSDIEDDKQYSIGIHPWDYNENWEIVIKQITNSAAHKSVVAIGETGFDPKSGMPIDLQRSIFEKHIELSEKLQKPIIVHCVKYFNELIQLKKSINPKQEWIIHGFRGKISIAKELLENGFYFSINEDLLNDITKSEQLLKLISPNKLFLETDDKDIDIRNIYIFAAKIFDLEMEELVTIIGKNLLKCKI